MRRHGAEKGVGENSCEFSGIIGNIDKKNREVSERFCQVLLIA